MFGKMENHHNIKKANSKTTRPTSARRMKHWIFPTIVVFMALIVSCNITLIIWHHRHHLNDKLSESNDFPGILFSFLTTTTTSSVLDHQRTVIGSGSDAAFEPSCAILLFGLPRAFKQYVLPSLVENVVKVNLDYNCDYYMHFYNDKLEGQSRSGHGGTIYPDDVWLLPQAIKGIHSNHSAQEQQKQRKHDHGGVGGDIDDFIPIVSIVNDTNATFWQTRYDELMKFRNTRLEDGNYTYFPWKEPTYVWPTTLDNMVRQWHSIESVWDHMISVGVQRYGKQYSRVAMMRNDVVYITPIDIYKIPTAQRITTINKNSRMDETIRNRAFGGRAVKSTATTASSAAGLVTSTTSTNIPVTSSTTYDHDNRYVVIPNWAKYPINDRYISGPFDAVKVWAKQRFELIDEYALGTGKRNINSQIDNRKKNRFDDPEPGRVMHSETFLNATVFTIIQTRLQYKILEDNWICFLRVRADGAIWIDDCHGSMVGFGGSASGTDNSPPGFPGEVMDWIQPFLPQGTRCRKHRLRDKVRVVMELVCKSSTTGWSTSTSTAGRTRQKHFTKRITAS
jgi:hypothetical protein